MECRGRVKGSLTFFVSMRVDETGANQGTVAQERSINIKRVTMSVERERKTDNKQPGRKENPKQMGRRQGNNKLGGSPYDSPLMILAFSLSSDRSNPTSTSFPIFSSCFSFRPLMKDPYSFI